MSSQDSHVLRNVIIRHNNNLYSSVISGNDEIEDMPKLLCMIYSIEPHRQEVETVRELWGKKCNGFSVFSNVIDES